MIYIKDLKTKGFDCCEACHLLLSNFYRQEYEMVFYNIFDFSFNKSAFNQTGELGSCLRWPISIPNNVSQIYGLSIQGDFIPKVDALEIINPLLKHGIPVVIETSTFYCPWLRQYKTIDKPRYLLVFNSNGNWLDVIDTTLDQQRIKRLSFQDFPPKKLGIGTAVLTSYDLDYKKIFHMMVTHLKNLNIRECFGDCLDVLQKMNNLDNEFNVKGYYGWSMNSDIFFGQRLPNSAYYFSRFLKCIEKKIYQT